MDRIDPWLTGESRDKLMRPRLLEVPVRRSSSLLSPGPVAVFPMQDAIVDGSGSLINPAAASGLPDMQGPAAWQVGHDEMVSHGQRFIGLKGHSRKLFTPQPGIPDGAHEPGFTSFAAQPHSAPIQHSADPWAGIYTSPAAVTAGGYAISADGRGVGDITRSYVDDSTKTYLTGIPLDNRPLADHLVRAAEQHAGLGVPLSFGGPQSEHDRDLHAMEILTKYTDVSYSRSSASRDLNEVMDPDPAEQQSLGVKFDYFVSPMPSHVRGPAVRNMGELRPQSGPHTSLPSYLAQAGSSAPASRHSHGKTGGFVQASMSSFNGGGRGAGLAGSGGGGGRAGFVASAAHTADNANAQGMAFMSQAKQSAAAAAARGHATVATAAQGARYVHRSQPCPGDYAMPSPVGMQSTSGYATGPTGPGPSSRPSKATKGSVSPALGQTGGDAKDPRGPPPPYSQAVRNSAPVQQRQPGAGGPSGPPVGSHRDAAPCKMPGMMSKK